MFKQGAMKKPYFVNYYDFRSIKYLQFFILIKLGESSKSPRQIESNFSFLEVHELTYCLFNPLPEAILYEYDLV